MAIAKERRLEVASQPELSKAAVSKSKKAQENMEVKDSGEEKEEKKKEPPIKKPRARYDEQALNNTEALEEDDEVQEGINWSDSESESD